MNASVLVFPQAGGGEEIRFRVGGGWFIALRGKKMRKRLNRKELETRFI